MNRLQIIIILALLVFSFSPTQARENVDLDGGRERAPALLKNAAADCADATASAFLDVNNVNTTLLNGGDMWWDLNSAGYEVPKIDPPGSAVGKHSIFAGALWIGGIDGSGQLKVAAQTYRQGGNDFWPGPLDETGNVERTTCSSYDRFFEVYSDVVNLHVSKFTGGVTNIPESQIDESLLEWPGRGNPFFAGKVGFSLPSNKNLAPFFDVDGDGIYDPSTGDYPSLGTIKEADGQSDVVPDKMIWWVYNDKGNIHTETNGEAIGLEINATAFAFKTNDEINNMTFYKYIMANKASNILDSVYFAQWCDPDLGAYDDDYVGCDTLANLGIVYNGDDFDQGADGYGDEIPMLGVDYFKGPNDENGNELGMSSFIYYNNDFTAIGNPENASHFYGYMAGVWKNGNTITKGGDGTDIANPPSSFMFPSDPSDCGPEAWSECNIDGDCGATTPADRRFLQVSGPFRLQPDATSTIVVGVVWVPGIDYPCPSFDPILAADTKAQALFDNNFELLDGPDAPDLVIRELDQELIISLYNNPDISNNFQESYDEVDPLLDGQIDSTYTFQGYKVYQLRDPSVSASDLENPDKAKLVFQCDERDGVSDVINFIRDPLTGLNAGVLKVTGQNDGINHTFKVTNDAFANASLINNKLYYFMAVAYAHNEFLPFLPTQTGQASPYLEGRRNIKRYTAIPHIPNPQNGGMTLNAEYGESIEVTTLSGTGNGGNYLNLTDATIAEILANGCANTLTYAPGGGPINVTIYDPLVIADNTYIVNLVDQNDTTAVLENDSKWTVTNQTLGQTYPTDTLYDFTTDQAIPDFDKSSQGFTIGANQVTGPDPADNIEQSTAPFLGAEVEYSNLLVRWLEFVPDINGPSESNWVRSGDFSSTVTPIYDDYAFDTEGVYDDVLGRSVAPYCLTATTDKMSVGTYPNDINLFTHGPAYTTPSNTLKDLMSVDIVFSTNPDEWTRCPIIELAETNNLSVGDAERHDLRDDPSRNKDGSASSTSRGMGWFPGYAIDVESGCRLNMMFGENSFFGGENGNDMIWNPTGTETRFPGGETVWGGMHFTYVMFSEYDQGAAHKALFDDAKSTGDLSLKQQVFDDAAWTFIPLVNNEFNVEGLTVPNNVTVKVRVSKPYTQVNGQDPSYTFNFTGKAATLGDATVAEEALDLIKVVPNPYYAYSAYEQSQLDNRVKITNLPNKCDISILTLDGTLIRKFNIDVGDFDYSVGDRFINTLEWDLTNSKNIKVSSGMYIVHIDAGSLGERTLKWFGVMRPVDLDTF